jgi:phosphatidylserine/phosphatidylglycerophosphate/cardiolipin synthase-like enzyme
MKKRNWLITAMALILLLCATAGAVPADVEPINNRDYFPKILDLISHAKKSVNVILYLGVYYDKYPDSPSNRLISALGTAAKRGASVEVIINQDTPRQPEDANPDTSTSSFVTQLLKESNNLVRIYYDPLEITTHAKLLIVDSKYVVVGSFNWSYSSLEKNNETAVAIKSGEIAKQYEKYFNSIRARSKIVTPETR